MTQRILISTSSFAKSDPRPLTRLQQEGFDIQFNPYHRTLTKAEVLELVSGVSGLIAGLEPLDADILRRSQLKIISRCGAGLSNVDLTEAKKLGIKVFSTPDAPTEAVAELTLAAMLNLLRSIMPMDAAMRRGEWKKISGGQLQGKTVLIIGFGRIGRRLAELLVPFKIKLLIVDPVINKAQIPVGGSILSLTEALPLADVITLHCSGEDVVLTEHMFDLIKRGAYLLNAARGGLIDQAGLIRALQERRLAGVWLDTFWEEPYQGELTKFPEVLLTPHVGSMTQECRSRMEMEAVENLISGFNS